MAAAAVAAVAAGLAVVGGEGTSGLGMEAAVHAGAAAEAAAVLFHLLLAAAAAVNRCAAAAVRLDAVRCWTAAGAL